MKKKRLATLGGLLLAFGLLGSLLATEILAPPPAFAGPRANPRRGKVFYKNNCRTCHDGRTEGARELSPLTKTMDQWRREFAEGGSVSGCLPRVKQHVGTDLVERDLIDIQAYLIHHAADSDQPASCGN